MSNYDTVCDKCGSGNVIKVVASKTAAPNKPVLKMSEVAAGKTPKIINITHAVMTYTSYKLKCNNCGYATKPFIQNNQLGTIV